MSALRAAALLAGAAGLALYLWPALAAPVVLTSDSTIDLRWARQGVGIVSPAYTPIHPAKPGYLLFLRAIAPPGISLRRIVVLQSILLWVSIAGTSLLVARRLGANLGFGVYAGLIVLLRLRDSASIVMSEALAAALFLPFAAILLEPPKRPRSIMFLGLFAAGLFLVRPNVGAAAGALAVIAYAIEHNRRALLFLGAGFALLALPILVVTSPPQDPFRGGGYALTVAASDYALVSAAGAAEGSPADTRRAVVWRALHGLLGTEFYDARWSDRYRSLSIASRALTPFAILFAIAVLAAVPLRTRARLAKVLGLFLLVPIIVQSVVFGALPRYALPFLPVLFLYAVVGIPELARAPLSRRVIAVVVAGALVLGAAWQRHVLDWEWGAIESAGIRITFTIPRGRLPDRGPATLHVRIVPAALPSDAHVTISAGSGETLYDSRRDPERRPFVTASLPDSVLAQNRRADTPLAVVSWGGYDAYHYMIFPIIPPPWTGSARREGGADLSPATGIARGGLDWWTHAGAHQDFDIVSSAR